MAGFSINITAVTNQATTQINALNKRLAALQAPVVNLNKALSNFGNLSGFSKAWSGINNVMHKAFGVLSKTVPMLGSLTAGGIVAGLSAMVRTWDSWALSLTITSKLLDVMPTKLMALQNANRLAGGSAEEVAGKLQALGTTLEDALWGRNNDALTFFSTLHISFQHLREGAKDPIQFMGLLADKIKELHDNGLPAATIVQKFGQYLTEAQIGAALTDGAAGLAKLNAEAEKYNHISPAQIDALAEQQKSLAGFRQELEYVAQLLAVKLIPIIQPYLDELKDWLSNQDEVNKKVDEFIAILTDVVSAIKEIGGYFNTAAKAVGGWKNAIELLIAMKLVNMFGGVTLAVDALTAAMGLLGLASSPVLLTLAGIAAVGAAAYGVSKLWSKNSETKTSMDEQAAAAGYTKGGHWWAPTYSKGDETLSYAEMHRKLGFDPYSGEQTHPNEFNEGRVGPRQSSGGQQTSDATSSNADAIAAGMSGGSQDQSGSATGKFAEIAPRLMGDLKKDFNLTDEQAAGFVGNFGTETGGFSTLQEINPVGGGRGGLGWAQWTGPRRREFEEYCKENNLDPSSYAANYGFMRKELQGKYKGTLDAVRQQNTVAGATSSVEGTYEGAGVVNMGSRINFANKAFGAGAALRTATAQPQKPLTGAVSVDFNFNNAPANSRVSASSSGIASTPRVVQPMASFA